MIIGKVQVWRFRLYFLVLFQSYHAEATELVVFKKFRKIFNISGSV